MEGLDLLFKGFANSLTMVNLLACFIGALVGTIVGVLPGLGPTATMALMLPFTLKYSPETGLIMMAGVWFGSQYGGSTTSILVNIPGEAASVVTCIDGYQMTKKGRAGAALALVAVGSFIAGTIGIIGLQFFAPILGNAALSFGPPEYLAFMVFALILLSNLSSDAPLKGFLMVGLGLFISSIGINPLDSYPRFTFGSNKLMLGIEFLPLAMGFFGIAEILSIAVETYALPMVKKLRLKELYPNKEEIKRSISPTFRGSILGFFCGLLPGPCTVISTFISYSIEKSLSKTPQEFGKGAVEGVVGPESANNSAAVGAMIPLLSLGIPFAAAPAMLLAGLTLQGVQPGPLLITEHPEVFWGVVASMYIGNLALLALNLPLVGMWVSVLRIPQSILQALVILLCLVGAYTINNSLLDLVVLVVMGGVGYISKKINFDMAPMILGLVLGSMLEMKFVQSRYLSRGDLLMFFHRPISGFFISALFLILVVPTIWRLVTRRRRLAPKGSNSGRYPK